ncbi:major histocompatibility complex class I-related gene protein-like isoform X5 [Conger conger]|uniref:major histocompatibility complex class I-related gene protein-like isoform X5 n=1 Tax=Conger conger TaxID=82655 RepID=UPI002A5AA905|nr:major histocompatibility complex class I-related gene protein-like isoform X5 [Conger conger]
MLKKKRYLNVFLGMNSLLWVVLCGFPTTDAASHSLKYFYTAVTPGIDFPEFTTVGLVDDEPFTYYDSNIRRETPKTEWIKKNVGEDYWNKNSEASRSAQQTFNDSIGILMQRFNHNQGVHTVQYMYGCEWDDETGNTTGFDQYGYDGEDFIALDMRTWSYITPVQEGFLSAWKWNHYPAELEYEKRYLTQECVYWLKKYVSYGKSTLERRVKPQVSLLQKDTSSPVTCHVTGFYPRAVMVTWKRDGQELDVDVELGETVPNGDGMFQTWSDLRVKPEDWKRNKYTCTVQHKSLEDDIILLVTEKNIKSNKESSMGIIIGCVLGALLLIIAVIAVVLWKKRTSGYGKTSTADTDSANSDQPAVKVKPKISEDSLMHNADTDSVNSMKSTSSEDSLIHRMELEES